jgi:hypothetical protein
VFDHELDGLRRDLLDGRGNFLAQRRELRVDHEDTVRPDEHANGASLAFECVELVGHLGGLDFDLAEIGGLGVGERRTEREDTRGKRGVEGFHRL